MTYPHGDILYTWLIHMVIFCIHNLSTWLYSVYMTYSLWWHSVYMTIHMGTSVYMTYPHGDILYTWLIHMVIFWIYHLSTWWYSVDMTYPHGYILYNDISQWWHSENMIFPHGEILYTWLIHMVTFCLHDLSTWMIFCIHDLSTWWYSEYITYPHILKIWLNVSKRLTKFIYTIAKRIW